MVSCISVFFWYLFLAPNRMQLRSMQESCLVHVTKVEWSDWSAVFVVKDSCTRTLLELASTFNIRNLCVCWNHHWTKGGIQYLTSHVELDCLILVNFCSRSKLLWAADIVLDIHMFEVPAFRDGQKLTKKLQLIV